MKKSKVSAVVFLILLLGVTVLCIVRFNRDKTPGTQPTPTAAVTQDVQPGGQPGGATTPTPEVEPSAEPTPTPTSTPEATAAPVTTAPVQTGNNLGQGSFQSNTGSGLELLVRWTAYDAGGGQAKLDVSVSARSYAFQTSALPGSMTLTVGGSSYVLGSAAIDYRGESIAENQLASTQVTVPVGSTELSVNWNYRGKYGKVELENITASGTANIG